MAIPTDSILQLMFVGNCFGQRIRHVRSFHLQSGGSGGGNPIDYQDSFIARITIGGTQDLASKYLACLSSSYTLTQIRAQIIYPTRYAYAFTDLSVGNAGTRAATTTANVDASIEASTILAGRSQVASYKIGPIFTGDSAAGEIVAGLKTPLLAYSATFQAAITTTSPNVASWFPCIYHRAPAGGGPRFDEIYEASPYDTTRVKTGRTVRRGE